MAKQARRQQTAIKQSDSKKWYKITVAATAKRSVGNNINDHPTYSTLSHPPHFHFELFTFLYYQMSHSSSIFFSVMFQNVAWFNIVFCSGFKPEYV
jgi:hypothetical protein